MPRNVVFDIGGVLADYRLVEFLAAKSFTDPTLIKRIVKASVMSPYWTAFERDEISEDEALAGFASIDPEIKDDLQRAFENIEGMLEPTDYADSWLKQLKEQGVDVYYLSNYSRKAYNECHDTLHVLQHMDGGCLSFQEHLTKPDPAFFQLFLDRFGLEAKDCYFVDDTKENVEAANALGFTGILFEGYESAAEKIQL